MMQLHYPHRLWADLETRSGNPITSGSYVYAEDSELLLFMYALDDAPVQVWDAASGQPMPQDLHEYLSAGQQIELAFHNTGFDRVQLITWPWARQYPLPPERFYCTMTAARMAGMPGGLDDLCHALEMPEGYSKKDGNALIRRFCIPNATGQFTQPWEAPAAWQRFVDYGVRDVVAMREAMRRIPDMLANPVERALMAYSDVMNDRGIPVDRDLANKAMLQADRFKADARRRATDLVGDDFNPASQQAILALASTYGLKLDDARSATLEKVLDSAQGQELLPPALLQVLALRVRSNKASTAKYSAILKGTNSDDRARGLVSFYGAGRTGRDAGRRFQPQNLARPVYIGERIKSMTMDEACKIVKAGTAPLHVDNPMQLLSDTVRGTVCVPPGRKFCGADLSAIEGRVLPWLMGEDWKVQYFRDLDAGRVKYDGYQLAYSVAFGVDPSTVTKAQRTLGKPVELATGFGGGVGALITFAALYRIDLDVMAAAAHEVADQELWNECVDSHPWFLEKGMTYGLSPETWAGCQYIVKAWRRKHPATVAGWKRAEEAFRNAIHNPGVQFTMAHNTYVTNNSGWLFVTLPSGRNLVYPKAFETFPEGKNRGQLAFWGVNPFTKKWGVVYTYSGRLCIAAGTPTLTRRGWVPIETVRAGDEVWDGVEWVRTDGAVFKGVKPTIDAYGARMTADHEVLTEAGWKSASQSGGYNRAACRLPDGVALPRERRTEVELDGGLRLREGDTDGPVAVEKVRPQKRAGVVRLHEGKDPFGQAKDSRYEPSPRVCGVAQHVRPLRAANTSSVGAVRGAWHNRLREVARSLFELLGRHGANIRDGFVSRSYRRERGVLPGELSLDHHARTEQQPAGQRAFTERADSGAVRRRNGDFAEHDLLPAGSGRTIREPGAAAGCAEQVFDLLNCGPRARFVIAAGGAPLIVHNCENITQAAARDVLLWAVPKAEAAGYPVVLRVHDELLCEVPDDPRFSGKALARIMSEPHPWCHDLPLDAAGEDTYRYQK